MRIATILLTCISLFYTIPNSHAEESECYGAVNSGAIKNAVRVSKGENYVINAWSEENGRTFVHTVVNRIIVSSFLELEKTAPGVRYFVGETGLRNGGKLTHHHTHQSGTSVDFMVPVLTSQGSKTVLPNYRGSGHGYRTRFDSEGRSTDGNFVIDFEALGEQLHQLLEASKREGHGIQRVILAVDLQKKLFETSHGARLHRQLYFFDDPNDRHDNHIHVDFAVPCKSMWSYRE